MLSVLADCSREIQSEAAQSAAALRVVPIIGPSHDEPAYRLLEPEVLASVTVTEMNESGTVPELKVINGLGTRVYLMDGQELIGAKQNRILNTDVLVPAKTTLTIPVSCVEAGRWDYRSRVFAPGRSASHRVRAGKQQRVHDALQHGGRHDAGQHAVWNEVSMSLSASGTQSGSQALNDAYAARQKDLEQLRRSLVMPESAVGLAVFHGRHFQGLDLFDRHTTLRFFWESLLDSYAIDWLEAPVDPAVADPAAGEEKLIIQEMLTEAAGSEWQPFRSPGEGTDHRLNHPRFSGSALVWEDRVLVHMQMFPKQATGGGTDAASTRQRRPRIHRAWGRRSTQENRGE